MLSQQQRKYSDYFDYAQILEQISTECRVNWQVQNYKIFLKNSTFGVEKSNFLRGRSLMAYWA